MNTKRHRRSGKNPRPRQHSPSAVVRIEDVSFAYTHRVALRSFTLEAFEGEILGLLGPNGSGKSTLFRILATLMLPANGQVEIAGADVLKNPHNAREQIGVVFQSPGLDSKLTVLENLRFQGTFYGMRGDFLSSRIRHLLESLGLWERRNDRVEILSGGLQRRTELAKGLLHQPRVLLLDEPSTGLDPAARRDFWKYLSETRRQFPLTVLLTTHLLDEAEKCDRVAILDDGRLVASGRPSDLRSSIGGDILTIRTTHPDALNRKIRRRFGLSGSVVDGEVHFELKQSAGMVQRIAKAFSDSIAELTLRKPSLEDVFLQKTGHKLNSGAEVANT